MREGWRRVALGDVVELDVQKEKVDEGATYKFASVASFGRGLFERDELKGDSFSYSSLHRLRTGQFVMSRLFAWEGAMAVVSEEFDGYYLSHEFPTFTPGPEIELGYLRLLTAQAQFWSRLRPDGMGGRRKRVKAGTFLEARVLLPPIAVQRRAIDLVDHLDRAVAASENLVERLVAAQNALREDLLSGTSAVLLSDVAEIGSGPSWKADDESTEPRQGSVPVLKITNTRPDGVIDLAETAHVVGLSPRTRTIDDRTLVLVRTNGNRERIGNVYLPPKQAHGFAVSAFQILARVAEGYDRELLFHALSRPSVQRRLSDAASGTTGLGNLGVRWLRRLEVPSPELSSQVLPLLRECDRTLDAAREELRQLQAARSAVLRDVLSGERLLLPSYDRFLDGVAA